VAGQLSTATAGPGSDNRAATLKAPHAAVMIGLRVAVSLSPTNVM
jgi:hypothetical protein